MWETIGQVGEVLDLPRSFLYSQGNRLAREMGYKGPEIKNFSDVLQHGFGANPESSSVKTLGVIGDILTDPLTYVGYPLSLAARGAAGRIAAQTAANPGRSSRLFASNNWQNLSGALANTAFADEASAIIRPMSTINDPWNMGDMMMQRSIVPGNVPDHYVLVESRVRPPRYNPEAIPAQQFLDQSQTVAMNRPERLLPSSPFRSYYEPDTNTVFIRWSPEFDPLAASGARREAMARAVIQNASQNPELLNNLPTAMRLPATLLSSPNAPTNTLGTILADLTATSLGRRSLWGQIGSGVDFLINPATNRAYYDIYRANPELYAPLVQMYGSLPSVFTGANLGTTGLGSYVRHQNFGTDQSLQDRLRNIEKSRTLIDQLLNDS